LTNIGLAAITGFDDASAVPLVTASSEVYQGVTVSLMAQIPVDKDLLFGDENRGELGPLPPRAAVGSYFYLEGKIKFKF
jgi:hypothetical protein